MYAFGYEIAIFFTEVRDNHRKTVPLPTQK